MKILLSHDYYRSNAPSGEDAVFKNECELLEKNGNEIFRYERFNDDIDESTLLKRVTLARESVWSDKTYEDVSSLLHRIRPDIAHFHNTFPLISPSAYAACQDNQVPVVQTLHNFRLICAGGMLMRDGRPCEDCVGTSLLPALLHRCYRGSITATSALVWMLGSNRFRGTYKTLVNRYIALTNFSAGRLKAGGIPEGKLIVKANFLPDAPFAGRGDANYAVYAGRLGEEKGVRNLITAWKYVNDFPLKILGGGPLRKELEEQARRNGLQINFLGFQPREEVLNIIGQATLQIIPSECYEGFPMVVLEAFACGTPLVASRIGSLDEIVVEGETGVKFEPGDPLDLAMKINNLRSDRERLKVMRQNARDLFDKKYAPDRNYSELIAIYHSAIEDFRSALQP